jgi:hypothetical protein
MHYTVTNTKTGEFATCTGRKKVEELFPELKACTLSLNFGKKNKTEYTKKGYIVIPLGARVKEYLNVKMQNDNFKR